ncbi:MAG: 2-isopropylmalate synthase [Acidobacteria bacterium]|nr:2-isopropylmalate synthase [Acidobacteriota bacterium]
MADVSDITIFDTTLRDGEQSPGFSMRTDEKLRLARQLDRLGVDVIESGFPIASEADAEAVRLVATEVRRPVIAALARTGVADIECAGEALRPAARSRIHTFLATSDLHLERKLRMTREACLDAAIAAVRLARRYTEDVQFSAEDATRSDLEFLCRVVEAVIDAGATTVNLPDTVGYSTPDEIEAFFRAIMTRVPNAHRAVFSTHCHDDLGLAVANSLAAVRGGARQVECTINGIGERAGNASLEEIVMVSKVRADRAGFRTKVVTPELFATSQLLTAVTGEPVQANKAIVGRNAFAHEAGIHQDGVLKDRRTYEIMRPEDVGVPKSSLVLGKHSGRHAVQQRCEEIGVTLSRQQLDQVYRKMIALADRVKHISPEALAAIAAEVTGATTRPDAIPAEPKHRPAPPIPEPAAPMAEYGYGHGV